MKQLRLGFISAFIYLGIAFLAAGIFLIITLVGNYTWVARIGGAAWIFLLATIILMPIVIPAMRKRQVKNSGEGRTFMWPFGKKEKKASGKESMPMQSAGSEKDPVCGMMVDPKTAPAKSEYKGKTYYFCAPGCKISFDKDPEKYLGKTGK